MEEDCADNEHPTTNWVDFTTQHTEHIFPGGWIWNDFSDPDAWSTPAKAFPIFGEDKPSFWGGGPVVTGQTGEEEG